MKKVLIISYHYYDQKSIGAVRIHGLAKFLPKFGWEPYILTTESNSKDPSSTQAKIFDARCETTCIKWKKMLGIKDETSLKERLGIPNQKNKKDGLDNLLKIWAEIFTYPCAMYNWHDQAVKLGNELIASESFDAMISSSGPPTCNLIAKDLNEIYGLPWIADFRDLWTQNHYYEFSRFRRFFERRLEFKTLSNADALTTVSKPLSEKLQQLHPEKRIFTIPNGFDPAQINPGFPLAKKFTITYTGSLYQGRRDPELLFQALGNMISKGLMDANDLSVEFYGPKENWIEIDAERYGLNKLVKINGSISRDASIEMQRRSHLLLLLTWNNKDEKGVYTGKIFDYLAACRPILSIGALGGVVEELLKITGAGIHLSSQEDTEKVIMKAYHEYKSLNTVSYHGLSYEIDKFSQIEMARKFSEVLDELVKP
jgi:hypothetical protein